MKTIFITIPWFSPAYKAGGPIQSVANMVAELKEGYRFYIFCGDTDLDGTVLNNIEPGKWVPHNAWTEVWYAPKAERSKNLLAAVEAIKPDILYSVGIFDWYFNWVPLIFCKVPVKILSVRGMLHPGALTQKKVKKGLFLQLLKLYGLQRKVVFHATDAAEARYIKDCFGDTATIKTAGNFPRLFHQEQGEPKKPGELNLISLALISPMKNHLLVLEALKQCTAQIQYDIYGPVKEMSYWQQCLEEVQRLPENITVQYHGDLPPAKVKEILLPSAVFILPSKSENFGHSIIEALSAGLPVITSTHIPWNGLEAARAGLNVETEATAIATAIECFAAMDADQFAEWSRAAATYASGAINIDHLKKEYAELFA